MSQRRMRIEQLRKTPSFRALSSKGKLWIESYVQSAVDFGGPDIFFSTLSAYHTTVGERTRTLAYKILGQKKLKAVLRVWENKSKREIALEQIDAEIAASRPGSAARARLLAAKATLMAKKGNTKMYKLWNRSSALEPEVLGALNIAFATATQKAIQYFDSTPVAKSLDPEQRKEAVGLLADAVTAEINKFAAAMSA